MEIETKQAKTLREYRHAYEQSTGESPRIIERGGQTYVNGTPMTQSEMKVATAKLQAKSGTFGLTSETPDERQELLNAIDNGNAGNLTIGKILQKRFEKGRTNLTHLEAWLRNQGRKLPAEGTRSKYRQAYEAWINNAGLDLDGEYTHPDFTDDAGKPIAMSLKGVSTYALYEARTLINRENPAETLAWVYSATLDEIKDKASDKKHDRTPGNGLKSLPKVPEGVYDRFKDLEPHFPEKSRLHIIEFLISFVHDLQQSDPDLFSQTVRAYFGEEE